MGYLSIPNLYREEAQRILEFKRLWATEKIHGTSASVDWKGTGDKMLFDLTFFSGGCSYDLFVGLFDRDALRGTFSEKFGMQPVTIYGEAYGGKLQGMSDTYGKFIKFVAFDVKVGDSWLAVPQAHAVAHSLGLDFVDYVEIPSTIEAIDAERDRPSVQAVKNGITEPKLREGVVLRPPFECTLNNGARLIAKHKRAEFAERSSGYPGLLDPAKKEALENAEAIVEEWVTAQRLEHVIDHIKARRGDGRDLGIEDTGAVIKEMCEDVQREAAGEVVPALLGSKDLAKAIGHKTVKMFKMRLEAGLRSIA